MNALEYAREKRSPLPSCGTGIGAAPRSFGKSAIWVLANGFFQTLAALLIALLLNQPFRGQNFVRTWIILPWAVPAAVTAILWRWMFDASAGIVNTTIKAWI